MLTVNEVTEIFYLSDEFSKEFETVFKKHLLQEDGSKKHRNKAGRLSESGAIDTIGCQYWLYLVK